MNKTKTLIIGGIGAVVIVGVLCFALLSAGTLLVPAKLQGKITGSASATVPGGEASATPSGGASPSATPNPSSAAANVDDLDGPTAGAIDTRPFQAIALPAVVAYSTVIPGETVTQRAARLAPFFPAGSSLLTTPPRIANPLSQQGITADVQITGKPGISATPDHTSGGLVFQAVLDWTATYKTSGTTMTVIKIGIWNVTMNTTFDGKVTAIVEPKDLR